jgi:hypothetical protein
MTPGCSVNEFMVPCDCTGPGHTMVTERPLVAVSSRSVSKNPCKACLVMEYEALTGAGIRPATLLTTTIFGGKTYDVGTRAATTTASV